MYVLPLKKGGLSSFSVNKNVVAYFRTFQKPNIEALIKKKKIKNHELHKIEDIEFLLEERRHDIPKGYPTIQNVHTIVDVNRLPVFKKIEQKKNPLNKLVLHFGDLSYLRGDAAVNGTNKCFDLTKAGNGYDCSDNFLKMCGNQLLEDIKQIRNKNKEKELLVTQGYDSAYKFIIHVVEPYYKETEKLQTCYTQVLSVAKQNQMKTIVFPLLGSGFSLFSKNDVVLCCLHGIHEFIKTKENYQSIDKIVLCTITDSYWMLLKEYIPLYLDININ